MSLQQDNKNVPGSWIKQISLCTNLGRPNFEHQISTKGLLLWDQGSSSCFIIRVLHFIRTCFSRMREADKISGLSSFLQKANQPEHGMWMGKSNGDMSMPGMNSQMVCKTILWANGMLAVRLLLWSSATVHAMSWCLPGVETTRSVGTNFPKWISTACWRLLFLHDSERKSDFHVMVKHRGDCLNPGDA